jgi:hypothetical protein
MSVSQVKLLMSFGMLRSTLWETISLQKAQMALPHDTGGCHRPVYSTDAQPFVSVARRTVQLPLRQIKFIRFSCKNLRIDEEDRGRAQRVLQPLANSPQRRKDSLEKKSCCDPLRAITSSENSLLVVFISLYLPSLKAKVVRSAI